jgi:ubiquinone/menaquinone biosynthesis C-methylase UbiE
MKSQRLLDKYYRNSQHPYRIYENFIKERLSPSATILDAGCGRNAPVLSKFIGHAEKLIGVDLEKCCDINNKIKYIQGNISNIEIDGGCVDIVISRAVLEHIENPAPVFKEIHRVLKCNGDFIFLVPNIFDYASLVSMTIPNKFHNKIVNKIEGRSLDNVFPAFYRANSYRSIKRLSSERGFEILNFQYLSQYPTYFKFNVYLFMIATVYEKIISFFNELEFLRGWILCHLKKSQKMCK